MHEWGITARLLPILLGVLLAAPAAGAGEQDEAEANAPQQVAQTWAVRRDVRAMAPEREDRMLAVKAPVYLDETLRAGEAARAQLLFEDKSVVTLGSDCELEVAKYVYDAKAKKGELKVRVKKGAFRILGGAISKKNKIEIETPVATCGIRGSLVAGYYDEVWQRLYVVVLKGVLEVTSADGSQSASISQAGYGTVIGPQAAPISVGPVSDDVMDHALDSRESQIAPTHASESDSSGGEESNEKSSSSSHP
jgi:hypothetical protein